MKYSWKVAAFVLAVVAAIFVASLARHIGRSTADYTYEKYKESASTQQTIEEQLEQSAKEFNKQLQATSMVNEQIRMDSVVAGPGKQFTYLFTVYQLDQITDEHLHGLFVGNRDRLCSGNLRRLLDSGVAFNYRYRDKHARWVRDVTVQSTDCGQSGR